MEGEINTEISPTNQTNCAAATFPGPAPCEIIHTAVPALAQAPARQAFAPSWGQVNTSVMLLPFWLPYCLSGFLLPAPCEIRHTAVPALAGQALAPSWRQVNTSIMLFPVRWEATSPL